MSSRYVMIPTREQRRVQQLFGHESHQHRLRVQHPARRRRRCEQLRRANNVIYRLRRWGWLV